MRAALGYARPSFLYPGVTAFLCLAVTNPVQAQMADMPAPGDVADEGCVCPPCSTLFGKLETDAEGRRVQHVEMQLRGEPKSRTSFMFLWAGRAMKQTCNYLNGLYGQNSCRTDVASELPDKPTRLTRKGFVFAPHLGGDDGRCRCEGVDRVSISLSTFLKHLLPVHETCFWSHEVSFAAQSSGCMSVDGRPVQNYADTRACIQAHACPTDNGRQQMVIFRDPRAMTVSSYFHRIVYYRKRDGTLDDYVTEMLPTLCHWMAVRQILFEEILGERSTVFWYDEAVNEPLKWHVRWLEAVGLHLPASVVQQASDAVTRDQNAGMLMPHPGGAKPELERSFRCELSAETLARVDHVLRTWLPPSYLALLGL